MAKLKNYNGRYCESEYESAFIALVVGAGSALAWYISIPRLGLLALGEPQTL